MESQYFVISNQVIDLFPFLFLFFSYLYLSLPPLPLSFPPSLSFSLFSPSPSSPSSSSSSSARFSLELIQTWALLRNAERALALINRITGAALAGVYRFPRFAVLVCSWSLWSFAPHPPPSLACCFVALCVDLRRQEGAGHCSVRDVLVLLAAASQNATVKQHHLCLLGSATANPSAPPPRECCLPTPSSRQPRMGARWQPSRAWPR